MEFKKVTISLPKSLYKEGMGLVNQGLFSNFSDLVRSGIRDEFKARGFYRWAGIRYFLFEYELHLKKQAKSSRDKLNWQILNECFEQDYYTIEHIYPQNTQKRHWTSKFPYLKTKDREALRHSLGNLLPLSKPKNSSLQDKSFTDKKGNKENKVGFLYGSYSENEVATYDDWTPKEILDRGLQLLDFMEERWDLPLGGKSGKINMLGLKKVYSRLISKTTKT